MEYERSVPQLKGLVNKTYPEVHESNKSLHLLTGLEGVGFEYRYGQKLPFSKRPERLWAPASHLFRGYQVISQEAKRSVSEVNRSPPYSAKVKNKWIHTTAPPVCLHGVNGEHFTSHFFDIHSVTYFRLCLGLLCVLQLSHSIILVTDQLNAQILVR